MLHFAPLKWEVSATNATLNTAGYEVHLTCRFFRQYSDGFSVRPGHSDHQARICVVCRRKFSTRRISLQDINPLPNVSKGNIVLIHSFASICTVLLRSLAFFQKGVAGPAEAFSNYIPPTQHNTITVSLIVVTLFLGIMIPDIEFVLGMVGSTIGSAVGIIFPSLMFIKVQQKNTVEKSVAQFIFVVGVVMMVVGTYSNLYEANRSMDSIMEEKNLHIEQVEKSLGVKTPAPDVGNAVDKDAIATSAVAAIPPAGPDLKKAALAEDTERREPVVPHPPKDEDDVARGEKQQEKTTSAEQRREKVISKQMTPEQNATSIKSNEKEIVKKLEEGLEKKVKKVVQKEKELEVRERKADELLQELQKQKDEQKQLIEEQKEVLQQMKEHVNDGQAQAPNEGNAAVVSQASREQENKMDFERLPSDNVIPARAKAPGNDEIPRPSPRGPMLSPDQYKNHDPAGKHAGAEDSQVQVHQKERGQPHNRTNMVIQRAEQSVYQQHKKQRPVVEPGGIQQNSKQDLPRGSRGQKQQLQNEPGFHRQGKETVDAFGEEERLYQIPNRGNQVITENEAIQRKSSDPKVGDKNRADTIDGEVGVGRDLKSMLREGGT